MKRKILAIVLSLTIAVAFMPTMAFADDGAQKKSEQIMEQIMDLQDEIEGDTKNYDAFWGEIKAYSNDESCDLEILAGMIETAQGMFDDIQNKKGKLDDLWQAYEQAVEEEKAAETIDKLPKKANSLTVKGKTATIKYKKIKKKPQTLKVSKVIKFTKKGQGKKTYKKVSVTYTKAKSVKMSKKALKKYRKKAAKKITINAKTGKVTVKKSLKKGTYKVKVKINAAGDANYAASDWKVVTFKIKVK